MSTAIVPKTLKTLATKWRDQREQRLREQKRVDEMKAVEDNLKEQVITSLRERKKAVKETGAVIDGYLYSLVIKNEPTVEDWAKLYTHIQKTGEFELLYRRVNNKAVVERWEQAQAVPGVAAFPVESLSVTKG